MLLEYKGFTIKVESTSDGYSMYSYRTSDNWILDYCWNPSIKTKKEAIEECKITIDGYWENPSEYED